MVSRTELQDWVLEALKARGGAASITEVAKYIWEHYEPELKASGDLFYTWQYDMRWACTRLRGRKIIKPAESSGRGEWRL
jgi:hypothetical protein